ncbi:ribosomal protection-like ABC-F family protein [Dictyobacter arantiisoli]|uniref:ABC transporter ATP-binding protein n=1 Tax=Dictyobacter arantiisoli TaxID=2014874 RepID=A0A5A5TAJ8_9CHLR|nr:ABC-F family ATP-binding cassette domain-containing protein [Dictyobacter arantiisoli]GCF07924.1 ABC transporter ATP-binding protein [Dictyobacter arantiisoli]
MLLVQFSKVSKDYAGNAIFDELDLEILTGERIGLVGENGCGKSTLLKLIADLETPTEGTIARKRRLTIGHLAQEIDPRQYHKTILEVVQEVSEEFAAHLAYLRQLEKQMADPILTSNPTRLTAILEAYDKAQLRFEALDGYNVEHRARTVLMGLGFSEAWYDQTLGSLSGGEKKLVNLARILVQTPDLLLLDEPDNHLDIEAKLWLEQFIREYPGTVMVISHDRHLLDQIVKKIYQLEDGALDVYTGNYSAYVKERQERLQQRYEYYLTQQDEIKRLEASLIQLREWAKQNDKFAGRMHNMEKRIARIKEQLTQKPVMSRNTIQVNLNGERGGKKVLEVKNLSIAINERVLCKTFDLTILHGERVGIVGENGSGKTTLLKSLLGLRPISQGEIKIGPSIITGYYAQEQETLPFEQTPLHFVTRLKKMSESQAIALLRRLLFSYQDMHTPIRALSGGEKSRLQIARLMLTEANFLVLDEPTNNLDIPSVEVLETTLQQFEGTILMVSHDRYFLDQVATKIIAIESDHTVQSYPGNFSYYSEKQLTF